jgi:CHAT domain-containing protein
VRKLGKLEALRAAQLHVLNTYKPGSLDGQDRQVIKSGSPLNTNDSRPRDVTGRVPPFYWAAFILSGDWR